MIVIKEEKLDSDDTDLESNDLKDGAEEEIVFEGQTTVEYNGEEVEDGCDSSIASKDDSKLDLWRVKQENPQFAFKGSPGLHLVYSRFETFF